MSDLSRQAAIVTGAARGIGSSVAASLGAAGASIVLCDVDEAGLMSVHQTLSEIGVRSEVLCADVSARGVPEAAVGRALDQFGSLEVLINGAGLISDARIEKVDDAEWDRTHAVNLKAPFSFSRAAVPPMRQGGYGRIVNVGSRAWLGGFGQSSYASAKGGLVSLSRTLALELAATGITVNTVAPGTIDTPMFRGFSASTRERLLAAQPSGRLGTADEVAAAIHFLASPEASFVTGQTLHVCGGRSIVSGPGHES